MESRQEEDTREHRADFQTNCALGCDPDAVARGVHHCRHFALVTNWRRDCRRYALEDIGSNDHNFAPSSHLPFFDEHASEEQMLVHASLA